MNSGYCRFCYLLVWDHGKSSVHSWWRHHRGTFGPAAGNGTGDEDVCVSVFWCLRATVAPTHGSSLGHGQRQVVVRHLDLVLSLQVSHPVSADAIDGHDDITLDQVTLRCLASWSDLSTHTH